MKLRLRYLFPYLLFCTMVSPAVAQGGGIFGPPVPNPAREITVCDSGCDATVIGGANCAVLTDTTEAAGSALARARALVPSETNPVRILVKSKATPYRECVSIDNITDLHLHFEAGAVLEAFAGDPNTIVNSWNGGLMDGGGIRIANLATPASNRATNRITISGEGHTIVYNHASPLGGGDAGIQIGREACAGTFAFPAWDNVTLRNFTAVGAGQGISYCGANASSVVKGAPKLRMRGVTGVGGFYGCAHRGVIDVHAQSGACIAQPNYCEADEVTFGTRLDAVTGTVQAGSTAPFDAMGSFIIEAADDPGVLGFYAGRTGVLTDADGGGAGECGAANACANDRFDANGFHRTAADAPVIIASGMECGVTITTGCAYTLDAVFNHWSAPCRRADWSVGGNHLEGEFGDMEGNHAGYYLGSTASASSLDSTVLEDYRLQAIVSDFGPIIDECQKQAGWLTESSATLRYVARLVNVDIDVDVTQDFEELPSSPTCANPYIAGLAHTGGGWTKGLDFHGSITVRNRADASANIALVLSQLSAGGTTRIWDAFLQLNNDAPGYIGTAKDLWQSSTGSIRVGDLRKDGTIAATGTILGLRKGLNGSLTEDIGVVTTCLDSTGSITVTGAAFGDACAVTTSAAPLAGQAVTCKVTAANTVKVNVCGAGDVPNLTYTVSVEKK
jgi:hypothetical protein